MTISLPRNASAPTIEAPVKVTKTDDAETVFRASRSLLVGTAGTATLVYGSGATAEDVPLQQGYNPLGGVVRVATGGTADDIWVLF